MKKKSLIILIIIISVFSISCTQNKKQKVEIEEKISTKPSEIGDDLIFQFKAGEYHNHPTFALWIEDMEGNYLHPLFVSRSVSSGIWGHGELEPGKWKDVPGRAVRTAALPNWFYKRSDGKFPEIPNNLNPVADAITSATPQAGFYLNAKSGVKKGQKYRILLEINQAWDWNDYWTNNKYPDDTDYKTSCQPALVYAVTIDPKSTIQKYYFNPIGHSHYSGKDGNLYTDLSTFTTALKIFDEIIVVRK